MIFRERTMGKDEVSPAWQPPEEDGTAGRQAVKDPPHRRVFDATPEQLDSVLAGLKILFDSAYKNTLPSGAITTLREAVALLEPEVVKPKEEEKK